MDEGPSGCVSGIYIYIWRPTLQEREIKIKPQQIMIFVHAMPAYRLAFYFDFKIVFKFSSVKVVTVSPVFKTGFRI